MLWRRDVLEAGGGVEALGAKSPKTRRRPSSSIAPACARIVKIPSSSRWALEVARRVGRQVRRARLRRATFPHYYAPELVTTSLITFAAAAIAASEIGLDAPLAVLLAALIWYGAETALALLAGWPLGWWSLPGWVARDLLLPWLWLQGWSREQFVWRGNVMSVDDDVPAADGPGPFPPE